MRQCRNINAAASAIALLWLLQSSASAAAPPKVLLLDLSGSAVPPGVRARVDKALASGLADQGKLDVVRGDDAGTAAEVTVRRIRTLLDEAQALVRQFKDKESLDRLRQAEGVFRKAAHQLVSVEPLVEILLTRAKIHMDAGRAKEAGWALTRVAVVDPSLHLHPGKYVPSLVQLFGRLRKALAKRTGQLRVKSLPGSLPVWIDGKRRATAPALLTVPAGEHLIAVGTSRRTAGIMMLVGEGRTTEVTLRLTSPDDNKQRSMATAAGATWIAGFVVSQQGGKYNVRLRLLPAQVLETPREVKTKPFDENQSTWAVGQLVLRALPLLAASTKPDGVETSPVVSLQETSKRGSIFRKWWFWTAVGAVVAVGGGATAWWLLSRDSGGVQLRLVP